jgi:hypothetical protein
MIPWFSNILIQDGVVWLEKMPQNSAVMLFLSCMTTTQKGREHMVNQMYSQWAADQRKNIIFMIKLRKEAKETKHLTNQHIVQTLFGQHDLLLHAVSQHHEDIMRLLIRNCTVLNGKHNLHNTNFTTIHSS